VASEAAGSDVAALLDLLDEASLPAASTIQHHATREPESASPASMAPPRENHTPLPPRAEPSGAHFMTWLRQGIQTRKIIINDAKALVHTLAGTVYLVSPGVFQRY